MFFSYRFAYAFLWLKRVYILHRIHFPSPSDSSFIFQNEERLRFRRVFVWAWVRGPNLGITSISGTFTIVFFPFPLFSIFYISPLFPSTLFSLLIFRIYIFWIIFPFEMNYVTNAVFKITVHIENYNFTSKVLASITLMLLKKYIHIRKKLKEWLSSFD